MAYRDDLQIWAKTLTVDATTSIAQRIPIPDPIYDRGYLREVPVPTQYFNQILNTITGVLVEETILTTAPATVTMLESIYPISATVQLYQNPDNPSTVYGFGTWVNISDPVTPDLYLWVRTA
ncbi:hypothetical protein S140_172 [Shewanella sp. phage 1/40]|uniref:hypothetical protein n=1 Tax=Shewanella sp. phage 1/40 TaxID=1458860 RepID=UPI0004F59458|nr:hypothetical protein S140_172 [Shewanella sp. phage 1/40]AHK11579.1 hypothetical protein S140_172 [Shewanella sp. phage 1/40]